MNTERNEPPAPPKTSSSNACLPCRNVKMRCKRDPSSPTCERCIRKSINCVFKKHRRGRKLGTRLKVLQGQTSPSLTTSANQTWLPEAASVQCDENARDNDEVRTNSSTKAHAKGPWNGSSSLQPAELLNRSAKTGKFSLQNVLSTANNDDINDAEQNPSPENPVSPEITSSAGSDDPVHCHLLSFPVALGLFNSFMRSLNPFISQFDPHLHTFQYVQQRSPFLLTSILAAAARPFHPSLHSVLRAHTEQLLAKCFTQGTKSTEIVQGVLVSTYWKEPDDTRSWLFVGYAIRMAIELGWHKLQNKNLDGVDPGSELSVREARNIRRTWLILFVYDRSISLQVDKPCMIEQTNFVTNCHDWYGQPHAVFGADALLCAFVALRILSSEIVELVSPDRAARHVQQSDHLMKLLNANITSWEEQWHPLVQDERVDPCQGFLIIFYGLHLRLLLNSYSVQNSLKASKQGAPISRQAVWTCHSTAIDMLKQISDKFGPLKLLYFAQDSVHVMTAYAAVFLIKLLLSLPASLSKELEEPALEAIRKAVSTFEAQCATQSTGCALQARFLKNVAVRYAKAKEQPQQNANQYTQDARQPQSADGRPCLETITTRTGNTEIMPQQTIYETITDTTRSQVPANVAYSGNPTAANTQIDLNNPTGLCGESEYSAWNFDNNDQWEAMFANAGYRIYDGVFLPEDTLAGSGGYA